jgi:plastocyanin
MQTRTSSRAISAVTVVFGCVLATSACAGSEASGSVDLVDGVEIDVDAFDNTFRPEDVIVQPGTVVVWTNKGRTKHNVLPVDNEDFRVEAEQFGPDAIYRHRFNEPGEYAYYCSLHGTSTKGMVGTVIVE